MKTLKPRKMRGTTKATTKVGMYCTDGPMSGHKLYVTSLVTLPFTYKGQTGRYVAGKWEAV
jgi:hypothetical protein